MCMIFLWNFNNLRFFLCVEMNIADTFATGELVRICKFN